MSSLLKEEVCVKCYQDISIVYTKKHLVCKHSLHFHCLQKMYERDSLIYCPVCLIYLNKDGYWVRIQDNLYNGGRFIYDSYMKGAIPQIDSSIKEEIIKSINY